MQILENFVNAFVFELHSNDLNNLKIYQCHLVKVYFVR